MFCGYDGFYRPPVTMGIFGQLWNHVWLGINKDLTPETSIVVWAYVLTRMAVVRVHIKSRLSWQFGMGCQYGMAVPKLDVRQTGFLIYMRLKYHPQTLGAIRFLQFQSISLHSESLMLVFPRRIKTRLKRIEDISLQNQRFKTWSPRLLDGHKIYHVYAAAVAVGIVT